MKAHLFVCGKSSSDPSYLEAHKRKHLADENGVALKSFICQICKKSFNRKGYFRTHLYNHKFLTLPRQDNGDHDENLKHGQGNHDVEIGHKRDVEKIVEVGKNPWMMTCFKLSNKKLKDKKGREFDGFPCSLCPKIFSRIPNLKAHLQAHDEGSLGRKEKVSKKKKRKSRSKKIAAIQAVFPKSYGKKISDGIKEISGILCMKVDKVIKEETSEKIAKSFKNVKGEKTKEELNANMDNKIEIRTQIDEIENTIEDPHMAITESQVAENVANAATLQLDKKIVELEERIVLLLPEKTKLVKIEPKEENVNTILMHQENEISLSNGANQECEKKTNTDAHPKPLSRKVEKKYNPCSFCGRVFSQIGNLNRHEAIKHKGVRLLCNQCPLLFKDKKTLLKHGWKHDDPKLQCSYCEIRFKHPDTLKNHIRVTHDNLESLLNCDICKKEFRNKDTLRLHKIHLHNLENKAQDRYTCEQCGKTKRSIKHLQDHTKIHHQSFHCTACGKNYKALRSLRDHALAQHPWLEDKMEKEYSCDQCGKKKASESLLKVHMKLHNQFFPCLHCGQIRKSIRSLKVHSCKYSQSAN